MTGNEGGMMERKTSDTLAVIFSNLTPWTMAQMVADLEDNLCTSVTEEARNLIIRNGEANCGDEFAGLLIAARTAK
jgi:hypothetical protein